jgi:hypothetical protein
VPAREVKQSASATICTLSTSSERFTCIVTLLGRETGSQQPQSSLPRQTPPAHTNAEQSLMMNDPG